ncbi:hypothetical protein N3K66_000286 [Trichothecium roseum]|uniref:Uncharacterized protein n=1 Tax=Trichothecium roseum TaxID=47278 RepID=A0ACC0VCZ3_9HYPO|nr:hypothetical protein N3K66_000286 [Trichothecium roseum]
MAPTAPSSSQHEKRPSARTIRHQRLTGQIHPLAPQKLFRPGAATSDAFLSTKQDKRLIRHSSFLSRVTAHPSTNTGGRVSKSRNRTRRPGNKLGADIGALADALPDVPDEGPNAGKVKHRSLKSRKGALKRKELVVRGEMDRFGASMAKLASQPTTTKAGGENADAHGEAEEKGQDEAPPQTSSRWAALRGYISATMEQNPAFVTRS